jgi:all-trans-retinol 13,14-reductase
MTSRSIGTPYHQFHDAGPFDAIVIGSGIGGLGTAATLAKAAGRRVLVLERHYVAGGLTQVFHRPGFEWDVGVHYVGQVHQVDSQTAAVFDYLTEGRLSWQAMPDAYDRVDIDGLRFDYVSGKDRLREALVRTFPREQIAIDQYFKTISRCLRSLPLFYAEKAMPPLVSKLVGGCLRAPFLRFARHTTGHILDELGASRQLKAVLTAQWGDYGLPPGQSSFGIHAIVAAHYFDGAAYPVGGASEIARSLVPTIERSGGAVVVGAEVDRILVSDGRAIGVRLKDGVELRASTIISDVGLQTTLGHLLPAPSSAIGALVRRVDAIGPSSAHLCLYVGISGARLRGPLRGSNLWIHPSLDFDRNWSAFAADLDAPFPLLFISFPSTKDPTFEGRYPGHQTIEVVVPAPYDLFMKWSGTHWRRRGEEYAELKSRLEERLVAALCRQVPQVAGAIDTCELSTPLSTRHFVNASHGQAYGLAHNPARFASRDLRPATPVRNLFLTGQDVSTCGVAGALAGAIASASAVLGRNLFSVVGAAEHARVTRDRIGEAA